MSIHTKAIKDPGAKQHSNGPDICIGCLLLGTIVDTVGEAVKYIFGRLKLARNLDREPDVVAYEECEGAHDGKAKIPSKDPVGDDVGS